MDDKPGRGIRLGDWRALRRLLKETDRGPPWGGRKEEGESPEGSGRTSLHQVGAYDVRATELSKETLSLSLTTSAVRRKVRGNRGARNPRDWTRRKFSAREGGANALARNGGGTAGAVHAQSDHVECLTTSMMGNKNSTGETSFMSRRKKRWEWELKERSIS